MFTVSESWHDPINQDCLVSPHSNVLFLSNLSLVDFCYSSVIVPNMLVNFWVNNPVISLNEWVTQFCFGSFAGIESFLLSVTACDGFVIICRPLPSTVTMFPPPLCPTGVGHTPCRFSECCRSHWLYFPTAFLPLKCPQLLFLWHSTPPETLILTHMSMRLLFLLLPVFMNCIASWQFSFLTPPALLPSWGSILLRGGTKPSLPGLPT